MIHLDKNNQKDIEKYWKEKEQEIGEVIKNKDISEYISGYQGIKDRVWGLLYYTENSFYFQTFPKRDWLISLLRGGQAEYSGKAINFHILWENVLDISIPGKRSFISSILAPPDYRVFIQYKTDNQQGTLVFVMYSTEKREKFLKFYHEIKDR